VLVGLDARELRDDVGRALLDLLRTRFARRVCGRARAQKLGRCTDVRRFGSRRLRERVDELRTDARGFCRARRADRSEAAARAERFDARERALLFELLCARVALRDAVRRDRLVVARSLELLRAGARSFAARAAGATLGCGLPTSAAPTPACAPCAWKVSSPAADASLVPVAPAAWEPAAWSAAPMPVPAP